MGGHSNGANVQIPGLNSLGAVRPAADPPYRNGGAVALPPPTPVVVACARLWNWQGLRRCFTQKDGFLLVEGPASADLALAQCQRIAPCVLIADFEIIDEVDPAEFGSVVDYGRAVQVLLYGGDFDERQAHTAIRLGCMGFLPEGATGATLKRAVRAVSAGELWAGRKLLTRILQQLLFATRSPKLTPRETDILRLIARGYKNRAIADALAISHETVRWHIRSLHSKLGLQDRNGTALYAQQFLGDEEYGPAGARQSAGA